ncbi:ammonium transporter [Zavarzinia aquatilis]|uniref:Ammonium transporter n=1 Tax=Zavarzinia aquatilis TaxID=2211142 RepID=A0A317E3Z3_9PROT|nr:ammonium transporter [Zavarzinia aquatilis]PWR21361.1 ammonium transporter [Zavarzinia aquatilis]
METAELQQKLEALEKAFSMAGTINAEIFYWWCTALMITIHAGFLAYEMGASRSKNALASGVKNILAFAFVIPTFFFFGWWIYLAFPTGFTISEAGADGLPWAMKMGPNLTDNATGVFWAAFALFAATTASILSGAVIERIRVSGFVILAVFLGSVVWILGASWGWHPSGWLTTEWGFHDTAAAGCVHMIAGFFTLGVLLNLGPRIGRFGKDGSVTEMPGHNLPMSLIGLMLIIVGFFGFLGGCIIFVNGDQWVTIFNTPATLSAFAFNTLMGCVGGILGCYLTTRDPFWMMSGALVGIISAASGLDMYYPPLAFLIGFVGGCIAPQVNKLLIKLKIDDAVGAVAVHGVGGLWSVIAAGIFIAGYPNVAEGAPPVSFMGQLGSAVVFALLGFIPGWVLSYVLKKLGLLRTSNGAEVAGLDTAEIPARAYPEAYNPPSRPFPAE